MMQEQKMVQSAVSHINNAKSEIESFNRSVTSNQKVKQELGLAYDALNDVINHCNTALRYLS